MHWQHDTDALAVADGHEHPVRAVGEQYRLGGAARWHGELTTRGPADPQKLFDAGHLVLRLPGGGEGTIRPVASATGNACPLPQARTPLHRSAKDTEARLRTALRARNGPGRGGAQKDQ
jgi:hypothetical protein